MPRSTQILLVALGLAVLLYIGSRTKAGADVVASVADTVGDFLNGPHGIRNNNPGNIERNSIQWQGELTRAQVEAAGNTWDATYVQFATPADGVRAIGHVLRQKAARGLTTVDAVIRNYSATDQDAYVANVSDALGVGPFDQIDVVSTLPAWALAIIQQENGQQPYDPAAVAQWVYA